MSSCPGPSRATTQGCGLKNRAYAEEASKGRPTARACERVADCPDDGGFAGDGGKLGLELQPSGRTRLGRSQDPCVAPFRFCGLPKSSKRTIRSGHITFNVAGIEARQ